MNRVILFCLVLCCWISVKGESNENNTDPQALLRDLTFLQKEPGNPSNVFHTIPVLLQLNRIEEALTACEKRLSMGGEIEEVFAAQFMIGRIQEVLKKEPKAIKQSLAQAYALRPHRMEPVYYFTQQLWDEEAYEAGYDILRSTLALPSHEPDALFVEQWISDYGLLIQYALFAAKTERYTVGLKAVEDALAYKDLPEKEKLRAAECKLYIQNQLILETQKKLQSMLSL